jgi:hypothetical protein
LHSPLPLPQAGRGRRGGVPIIKELGIRAE